jgi:hypothetical protein
VSRTMTIAATGLIAFLIAGASVGITAAVLTDMNHGQTVQEQVEIAHEQRELEATEAKLRAPAAARAPAILAHLGFCYTWAEDPDTGDVDDITITAPTDSGGVVACPDGTFVSVVPGK